MARIREKQAAMQAKAKLDVSQVLFVALAHDLGFSVEVNIDVSQLLNKFRVYELFSSPPPSSLNPLHPPSPPPALALNPQP